MPTQTSDRSRQLPLGARLGAGLLAGSLLMTPLVAQAAPAPESFAPLVDQVKGAVVNISTTELQPQANTNQRSLPEMPQFPPGHPLGDLFRQFQQQQQQPQRQPRSANKALGSGFIVDASGIVVTNNHVVEHGTDIKVTLQDGSTLDAKVLGTDPKTDLAVLKVSSSKPLPFVPFGDSDQAKVGDWVIAVGNPFGLGGTVTAGIVSARARDIGAGAYDDFLQVDASINPGNSGGPTFNTTGQVIGINTAIFSPNGGGNVGIGFAIPSNLARPIVAQLQKDGKVDRGWLGVSIQQVTPDLAQAMGLDESHGALVADVTEGAPAAKAGIKSGDVIVAVDGKAINAMRDLPRTVAAIAPGTTTKLDLLRQGKPVKVDVKVGQDPAQKQVASADDGSAADARKGLGLQLAPLDQKVRAQLDLPARTNGVAIIGVAPGSAAEQKNLQAGDVITKVNGVDVRAPADVVNVVETARKQQRKSVALLVLHQGQELYVAVPLI